MTSPTDAILTALHRLCLRAGALPDDASPEAAVRVRDTLRAEFAEHEVFHCYLNEWVRRNASVPHALVLHDRVFVPKPACERKWGEAIPGMHVMLPVVLRHAVQLFDKGEPMPVKRPRVNITCPTCGGVRRVSKRYAEKDSQGRRRYACAHKSRSTEEAA